MPTVEILRFPGSDSFIANPLVFEGALQILLKADGMIAPYYGIQKEDGRTGYLIIIWESYEHHMKLTQEPAYPEMIKSIAPAVSGPTDLQHVDFDEDATKALDAPATEVVVLTPKSGTAQEDFDAKIATLRESLNKEPACHVVAVGESREKKGTWFMLIGWDSIEAHMDVAAKDALKEIVKSFFAIADVDLVHTNLVKHTA